MAAVVVYKGIQHGRCHAVMGWNVCSGPFTRDRTLDLRGHAHSDTESTYDICTFVGTSSQMTQ
jgi:hypothetical protein